MDINPMDISPNASVSKLILTMLTINPVLKNWHLNLFIIGNHIYKTYFICRTDLLFERGKK